MENEKLKIITKENFHINSNLHWFGCEHIMEIIEYKIRQIDMHITEMEEEYPDYLNENKMVMLSEFFGKEPFYISFFEARDDFAEWKMISSAYWYIEETIYRFSDHWGYVSDCVWPYDGEEIYNGRKGHLLGRVDLSEPWRSESLKKLIDRKIESKQIV